MPAKINTQNVNQFWLIQDQKRNQETFAMQGIKTEIQRYTSCGWMNRCRAKMRKTMHSTIVSCIFIVVWLKPAVLNHLTEFLYTSHQTDWSQEALLSRDLEGVLYRFMWLIDWRKEGENRDNTTNVQWNLKSEWNEKP